MSKLILLFSAVFAFVITSCGPAAEEKAKMIQSAKRTSDSIANVINLSMSSATEGLVPTPTPPPAQPSATNTATAAPTPTVQKKP